MKTISINLYNIHELKNINNKAYNKILDNTRDVLIEDRFFFATEDVIESLKDKYNLNIDKDNIYYSISYCQGDGFCFIDSDILSYYNIKNKSDKSNAFEKWIINNLKDDEMTLLLDYLNSGYNLNIIKKSHNYSHCYTCNIDYEYFYSCDDPNYFNKMNDFLCQLCRDLFNNVYVSICNDIESMLYSYYDITEDDVIEYIDNNDYYYNIDGVIY